MACPTCNHSMANLCAVLGVLHYHCARCGTHRMTWPDGHTHDTVPQLVERCREFIRFEAVSDTDNPTPEIAGRYFEIMRGLIESTYPLGDRK